MGWKFQPFMGISMLDCPLQSQTSPMSRFASENFSLPQETVTVWGVNEAAGVATATFHNPSSPATAL